METSSAAAAAVLTPLGDLPGSLDLEENFGSGISMPENKQKTKWKFM